ncbi:hypothetical protein [Mitsuaria sp. GD03876]|uniref:hypothetical protein n=1 Tax=Mitsuaria sp. GD03876 TaxID=2975399 RepID=UPI002448072D|nr:hypothetical protein [Mitsuaria sp. GD03876]MDH0864481.1 hypothetical protein [Mitsuaria sp. GD03876]
MQREGQYRGVNYRVESTPAPGGAYLGHYQLLDAGRRRSDASDHDFLGGGPAANDAFGNQLEPEGEMEAPQAGAQDVVHPPVDTAWATENEALTYATEAACHAIEIMQLGRPQAQGRGSGSSWRRTDSLGQ